MVNRLWLALAFVFALFTGYALGQGRSLAQPLGDAPVFSGADFGFQPDAPPVEMMASGKRSVTGRFVVKVNGRWVEARPSIGVMPAK
jgi:hypothetical protein